MYYAIIELITSSIIGLFGQSFYDKLVILINEYTTITLSTLFITIISLLMYAIYSYISLKHKQLNRYELCDDLLKRLVTFEDAFEKMEYNLKKATKKNQDIISLQSILHHFKAITTIYMTDIELSVKLYDNDKNTLKTVARTFKKRNQEDKIITINTQVQSAHNLSKLYHHTNHLYVHSLYDDITHSGKSFAIIEDLPTRIKKRQFFTNIDDYVKYNQALAVFVIYPRDQRYINPLGILVIHSKKLKYFTHNIEEIGEYLANRLAIILSTYKHKMRLYQHDE